MSICMTPIKIPSQKTFFTWKTCQARKRHLAFRGQSLKIKNIHLNAHLLLQKQSRNVSFHTTQYPFFLREGKYQLPSLVRDNIFNMKESFFRRKRSPSLRRLGSFEEGTYFARSRSDSKSSFVIQRALPASKKCFALFFLFSIKNEWHASERLRPRFAFHI